MLKTIILKNNYNGIVANHLGYPHRLTLLVFDTETINGEPYLLQIYDGKEYKHFFVNKNNVLDIFLNYCENKILSRQVNVCYAHNLEYDLSVLLYKYHKNFVGKKNIKIEHNNWKLDIVMSSTTFATFSKGNKRLLLLDTYKFMMTSLSNFGKIIGSKIKKLERPNYIGEREPTKNELPYFLEYAKQDCLLQYEISNWVLEQFRKYDTRICFSNAHFSERIFRHYYIKNPDRIVLPPKDWLERCVLSYHGGKNGYYLDKSKGIYLLKDACEIDIISAYPYAMTKLPNFISGKYIETDKFLPDYEGIYEITGISKNCKYPIIYSHDFKPISYNEKIKNLCITSYELREAIAKNEIEIIKIKGLLFIPNKWSYNPLKDFVKHFFRQKSQAKNIDEKMLYKIILNSLYGKFIQAIEIDDGKNSILTENYELKEKEKIFRAGNCYQPFIASLITGFVRTYLHKLEHKYKAVHSSTDSIIFKCNKNFENNFKKYELGSCEIKVRGDCYLIRNKVYIWLDKNKKITKYATHGLTLSPDKLLDMIKNKQYSYKIKKMIKVREAEKRVNKKLKRLTMNIIEKEIKDVNFERTIVI